METIKEFIVQNLDVLTRCYIVYIMGFVVYLGNGFGLIPSWQNKWRPSSWRRRAQAALRGFFGDPIGFRDMKMDRITRAAAKAVEKVLQDESRGKGFAR